MDVRQQEQLLLAPLSCGWELRISTQHLILRFFVLFLYISIAHISFFYYAVQWNYSMHLIYTLIGWGCLFQ